MTDRARAALEVLAFVVVSGVGWTWVLAGWPVPTWFVVTLGALFVVPLVFVIACAGVWIVAGALAVCARGWLGRLGQAILYLFDGE